MKEIDMVPITIELASSSGVDFFNNVVIKDYMPDICLVSEMKMPETSLMQSAYGLGFRIYLKKYYVQFGFENEQECKTCRKILIRSMSAYWGAENLIFSNPGGGQMPMASDDLALTDMFVKDGYASYAIKVASMPPPTYGSNNQVLAHDLPKCEISQRELNDGL